jgi:hypothetical protein
MCDVCCVMCDAVGGGVGECEAVVLVSLGICENNASDYDLQQYAKQAR